MLAQTTISYLRAMDSPGDGEFSRERRKPMEPEEYDYDYDEHPDDEGGDVAEEEENDDHDNDVTGAEDAILDLVELEQLQEEAERMKGLGNKHMAAQVSFIVSTSVSKKCKESASLLSITRHTGHFAKMANTPSIDIKRV